MFVWASLLFSNPLIWALLYFAKQDLQMGLPPDYAYFILVAGITAGVASMVLHKRFAAAVNAPTTKLDEYLNKVLASMVIGMAVSEIPFFMGLLGWMIGGFVQTATLLAIMSFLLQLRFKPPKF